MMITLVMGNGKNKPVQVNSSDDVASLYQKAGEMLGLQRNGFELHYGTSILEENRKLICYAMCNGDSIIVVVRVRGGLAVG